MQLAFISGTFFIFFSLTFLSFKYATITHEVVQAFYQQQQAAFYEQSLLAYGIGLFLEHKPIRTLLAPLSIHEEGVEYLFCPQENQGVAIRVKGIKRQYILSPLKGALKREECNIWTVHCL